MCCDFPPSLPKRKQQNQQHQRRRTAMFPSSLPSTPLGLPRIIDHNPFSPPRLHAKHKHDKDAPLFRSVFALNDGTSLFFVASTNTLCASYIRDPASQGESAVLPEGLPDRRPLGHELVRRDELVERPGGMLCPDVHDLHVYRPGVQLVERSLQSLDGGWSMGKERGFFRGHVRRTGPVGTRGDGVAAT